MVIAIIGESCTGKTSVANQLKHSYNAEVYSGKDYLRLAKNPEEAKLQFKALLNDHTYGEDNIVFMISEMPQLALLPQDALKVLMTADLATKKERFAMRLNGMLPPPVAAMLEKKHGTFDGIIYDLHLADVPTEEAEMLVLQSIAMKKMQLQK